MLYGVSNYVLNFQIGVFVFIIISIIAIIYGLTHQSGESDGSGLFTFAFLILCTGSIYIITTTAAAVIASPCEAQPKAV